MVEDRGSRGIVERYVRAFPGDFAVLAELRHRDFVEEWPQSGERIRGHANYRAIHEQYPGGLPASEMRRVLGDEDRWVLTPSFTPLRTTGTGNVYTIEGSATYPNGDRVHIVCILELRDGKVHRQTTYFAPPFEAPQWRAKFVERM
jgi:hypothetical protein